MKISRAKIREIESYIEAVADNIVRDTMKFHSTSIEWTEIIDSIRREMSRLDIKLTELEEYVDSTEEVL